jgi:hypothetical protein
MSLSNCIFVQGSTDVDFASATHARLRIDVSASAGVCKSAMAIFLAALPRATGFPL